MTTIECCINRIIHGDCIEVMRHFPPDCIDLIVTDPPYVTRYESTDGRRIKNDDTTDWIKPAYSEMFRVLKPNCFCVTTYGWNTIGIFMHTWRAVGFRPIGHFVWVKNYASSVRFTRSHHEMAYLLIKGEPPEPENPPSDVLSWQYTGNKFHPTQKPVMAMTPFIRAFSKQDDIVLDPFIGSGTTAIAALHLGRRYIGIELDADYAAIAQDRIKRMEESYAGTS